MPKTWASFGVDLQLDVSGSRLRAGVEAALREAVRSGRIRPGTRMPSSRGLARELAVARNTVTEAYGQLVAEGWLASRPGSGTWVAERPNQPSRPPLATASEVMRAPYDLRPGEPDLSAFPRSAWLAASRRALAGAPYGALGYSDPQGLRSREPRSATTSPERGVWW
jgi:GntR family transcriptional regulator / MocR family aminotransferase